MLAVFVCEACPLVFQVGGYVYWDCSGRQEQVVCYGCGTMHRLIEERKVCRVFALARPVRETKAVYAPDLDWCLVGKASSVDGWRQLRCVACQQVGQLRSRERLLRQAEWPEDPVCPLCRKPIQCVSCVVIN
jgi:hypothetical protein